MLHFAVVAFLDEVALGDELPLDDLPPHVVLLDRALTEADLGQVTAAVELAYASPKSKAEPKLRVTIADQKLETTLPAEVAPEIALPHRDEAGRTRYRNRDWVHTLIGSLRLKQGPAKLVLEAISLSGAEVMDLKHVKLTRR